MGTQGRTARRVRSGRAVRVSEEAGNPPTRPLAVYRQTDLTTRSTPKLSLVTLGMLCPPGSMKDDEAEPSRPAVTFTQALDASTVTASRLRAVPES